MPFQMAERSDNQTQKGSPLGEHIQSQPKECFEYSQRELNILFPGGSLPN
jgi:hypothetical protein